LTESGLNALAALLLAFRRIGAHRLNDAFALAVG
jgi:hypothetical protein